MKVPDVRYPGKAAGPLAIITRIRDQMQRHLSASRRKRRSLHYHQQTACPHGHRRRSYGRLWTSRLVAVTQDGRAGLITTDAAIEAALKHVQARAAVASSLSN